ncbi:MAG: hypothetical protein AABZ32_02435 [Bacteroidota bacterium]
MNAQKAVFYKLIPFNFIIIGMLFLVVGCAPQISRIGYESSAPKEIVECKTQTFRNVDLFQFYGKKLGSIEVSHEFIGDNCSERDVKRLLHQDACNLNANAIVIKSESTPQTFGSGCYDVKADFYVIDSITNADPINQEQSRIHKGGGVLIPVLISISATIAGVLIYYTFMNYHQ